MAEFRSANVAQLVDGALAGRVSEADLRQLIVQDPDSALALIQLLLSRITGPSASSANTPSGQLPPYEKPPASKVKRGKRGARAGHAGSRRPPPARIDRQETHACHTCPTCGESVQPSPSIRSRVIEDLLDDHRVIATEHIIHRGFCPNCRRRVEPAVPDAMPGATFGHRLTVLTAWFHYGLGITIRNVVEIFAFHLHSRLTAGGLVQAWRRLGLVLASWHDQIAEDARHSAVLHADETGWRVEGTTHWLWCFANDRVCYYMIDRSRGSPALQKFFTDAFEGTLVTDFWSAYARVDAGDRQYCLAHLLRELEEVDARNRSPDWMEFCGVLRTLLGDAMRLRSRRNFTPEKFRNAIDLLNGRLLTVAQREYRDKDASRLAKRLLSRRDYLLTFLDKPEVPATNNLAERAIRPAVILRKNSQSNRSDAGAATQAVLMSVFRTLKMRGLNPIPTLVEALRTYVRTGQLPPLPTGPTAIG